jgi:serine/threonine protein kinase
MPAVPSLVMQNPFVLPQNQSILPNTSSEYEYEHVSGHDIHDGSQGKQAAEIVVVKRRARTQDAALSKELYACKYYVVEGQGPQDISGPKYIIREWHMLSKIEHPNILRYEDFAYDHDERPRLARLYTEYCSEGNLSQFNLAVTSPKKRLGVFEVAQVFYQLAQALLYLHYGIYKSGPVMKPVNAIQATSKKASAPCETWLPILHRDIKPPNGVLHCKSD